MTAHPNDVISYWRYAGLEKWFKKVVAFDETIRLKFESTHHHTAQNKYNT